MVSQQVTNTNCGWGRNTNRWENAGFISKYFEIFKFLKVENEIITKIS